MCKKNIREPPPPPWGLDKQKMLIVKLWIFSDQSVLTYVLVLVEK